MMKGFILKGIAVFLQYLSRAFVSLGIIRPKAIIYMDGGIASQMLMYLEGQYYARQAIVLYDTSWYKRCGKDMDGRFDRIFELVEMFPHIEFRSINSTKRRFYKSFFKYSAAKGFLPRKINRTTYFDGYFELPPTEFDRLFSMCFRRENLSRIARSIPSTPNVKNVAVHVRRGDLANRESRWYKAVPLTYFINALNYVKGAYENIIVWLFSDEPDWVEKYLCPRIDVPANIVRGNKAYEDLILISECDIVIASQGSFGSWGGQLNGNCILITPSSSLPVGFAVQKLQTLPNSELSS